MVPLSAGDEVGGKGGPPSPSATGLEGIGGDCIAKSSSPRSKAAMSEVLTLEDFSLAKALKLYPTLKEQLLVDNGLIEKQEEEKPKTASSLPAAATTRKDNSCEQTNNR